MVKQQKPTNKTNSEKKKKKYIRWLRTKQYCEHISKKNLNKF